MDPKLAIRTQSVLAHVTVFQVLTEYGIRYSNNVTQQIHCPVHKDRTPSARVYAETNKVYCFTCSKLWDVIAIVQAKQSCDFIGALAWLETRFLVPPASANLTDVLKAGLRRRTEARPEELYELVEARLIARRDQLGFLRYTKGLMALDLLLVQAKQHVVTSEQFAEGARSVLQYVSKV